MNIKTQTRGSTHTVIEKGRYAVYNLKTETAGRLQGGNHQVDFELTNRTGKHFNPNVALAEGNIVNVKRVTTAGEAVFFSASESNRLNLLGRKEEILPQVKIDRLGAPADIFIAGVDGNGIKRYAGQTVLPKDGSYATVTPGEEAIGEVTIHLV